MFHGRHFMNTLWAVYNPARGIGYYVYAGILGVTRKTCSLIGRIFNYLGPLTEKLCTPFRIFVKQQAAKNDVEGVHRWIQKHSPPEEILS